MFTALQEPEKFNFIAKYSYKKQEFEMAYINGVCFLKDGEHFYDLWQVAYNNPEAVEDWFDFGEFLGGTAKLVWRGYHVHTKI